MPKGKVNRIVILLTITVISGGERKADMLNEMVRDLPGRKVGLVILHPKLTWWKNAVASFL